LSQPEQSKLCDRLRIIIAETYWEGCEGFAISDKVRVTIAGNAALLIMGSEDYCFEGVRTVLVFPGSFARDVRDGYLVTQGVHHSGEAYQSGTIVLSWADVQNASCRRGRNVVIHEFAHHIDGLDGAMEGEPPLSNAGELRRWRVVANREFEQLVRDAQQGRRTLLDQYGATNPAEFFAVASECFFERPVEMQRGHARLFDLLTQVYQLDPRKWSQPRSA
jgi:Mlc titration factor MtfA (ptsG expression regulator)